MCKDASCTATNRANRFIVLGSSGEVLPVTRKSLGQMSVYSSCNSQSTDSFHSAKETIDEEPGTVRVYIGEKSGAIWGGSLLHRANDFQRKRRSES